MLVTKVTHTHVLGRNMLQIALPPLVTPRVTWTLAVFDRRCPLRQDPPFRYPDVPPFLVIGMREFPFSPTEPSHHPNTME